GGGRGGGAGGGGRAGGRGAGGGPGGPATRRALPRPRAPVGSSRRRTSHDAEGGESSLPALDATTRSGLLQAEDEERTARREVLDLGPEGRVETQHQRPQTARHRDVLLAVDGVADRPAAVAGAGAEAPQLLAGVGVVGVDDALDVAVEHQPAAGREDAADRRVLVDDAPLLLAAHGIAGVEMPVGLAPRRMLRHLVAAEE